MAAVVDDIGSFPLPSGMDRRAFSDAYASARKAIVEGRRLDENDPSQRDFIRTVTASFKMKLEAGLDIVNYPQHYDIHRQLTDVIHEAMKGGTYVVDESHAVLPEVHAIEMKARELSEEFRKKIPLRVCVTGPLELYLKEVGTTAYKDVILMIAETVRRFARNSILDSKYVRTEVVSIDEPSFGLYDVTVDKETVLEALEKALDFAGVTKQIHLHSASRITDIVELSNFDVASFEYAASPRNIDAVSKGLLEKADKQIRIGVSRTDVDSIMAELSEKGITKPRNEQLVEDEETIRKRYAATKRKYGERMTFTGPDCGLGGWPTQESARLLLKRTVNAVKSTGI